MIDAKHRLAAIAALGLMLALAVAPRPPGAERLDAGPRCSSRPTG